MPLKRMVIFVVLFLFALRTYAQEDSIIVDTNFYECFTRELIIRLSGKSITAFSFCTPEVQDRVSPSASYGVSVLYPDFYRAKGKTKALNLQNQFYDQKNCN